MVVPDLFVKCVSPDYRILGLKFPRAELVDHLVKPAVYLADLGYAQAFDPKPFRDILNLAGRDSVQPAFLHDLDEGLLAAFLLRHKERNVASLPQFGNRKINSPEPRVMDKFMEIEVAHKTGAEKGSHSENRTGYRCGYRIRRFDTRENFQHRIFCRYKIQ